MNLFYLNISRCRLPNIKNSCEVSKWWFVKRKPFFRVWMWWLLIPFWREFCKDIQWANTALYHNNCTLQCLQLKTLYTIGHVTGWLHNWCFANICMRLQTSCFNIAQCIQWFLVLLDQILWNTVNPSQTVELNLSGFNLDPFESQLWPCWYLVKSMWLNPVAKPNWR